MARVFLLMGRGLRVINVTAILCLWLLLGLYLTFKMGERNSMIAALPAAVEISGVEWIAGDHGFREGCGVAVFRLAPDLRLRLHERGLSALAGAVQGRGHPDDDYYHYADWGMTPSPDLDGDGGWWGMGCVDLPPALQRRIYRGLGNPGSYVTHKDEGGLLVAPAEGLVVFSYNG